MLTLTRKYTFSAAHKLWNPALSDADNLAHFGACANLHGHNYLLAVTITGPLNDETGVIIPIKDLDEVIQAEILDHVDHRYLDQDVAFLSGTLSTLENLAHVFCHRLIPKIPDPAQLVKVRLYECDRNWIDVTPETLCQREPVSQKLLGQ